MTPRWTRPLRIGLRVLLLAMVLAGAARAAFLTTYRVSGTSMLETLHDGDRILVADASWLVHPIETGDTVILDVHGEVLVKRVVAAPGDSIALSRGQVLLNGQVQHENIPAWLNRPDSFPEYHLLGDEYFVLGDNRLVSVDSRDFGPVRGSQVLGRVLLRVSGVGVSPVAALDRR